jgi:hypothetical protein
VSTAAAKLRTGVPQPERLRGPKRLRHLFECCTIERMDTCIVQVCCIWVINSPLGHQIKSLTRRFSRVILALAGYALVTGVGVQSPVGHACPPHMRAGSGCFSAVRSHTSCSIASTASRDLRAPRSSQHRQRRRPDRAAPARAVRRDLAQPGHRPARHPIPDHLRPLIESGLAQCAASTFINTRCAGSSSSAGPHTSGSHTRTLNRRVAEIEESTRAMVMALAPSAQDVGGESPEPGRVVQVKGVGRDAGHAEPGGAFGHYRCLVSRPRSSGRRSPPPGGGSEEHRRRSTLFQGLAVRLRCLEPAGVLLQVRRDGTGVQRVDPDPVIRPAVVCLDTQQDLSRLRLPVGGDRVVRTEPERNVVEHHGRE